MQTQLVRPAQEVTEREIRNEKPAFIEKEVDMGFFDHHFFQVKDGILINDSCQRINKCSCNCNHCSWGIM